MLRLASFCPCHYCWEFVITVMLIRFYSVNEPSRTDYKPLISKSTLDSFSAFSTLVHRSLNRGTLTWSTHLHLGGSHRLAYTYPCLTVQWCQLLVLRCVQHVRACIVLMPCSLVNWMKRIDKRASNSRNTRMRVAPFVLLLIQKLSRPSLMSISRCWVQPRTSFVTRDRRDRCGDRYREGSSCDWRC